MDTYRERSARVRVDAAEHLLRLRQERLARRRPATATEAPATPAPVRRPPLPVSREAAALLSDAGFAPALPEQELPEPPQPEPAAADPIPADAAAVDAPPAAPAWEPEAAPDGPVAAGPADAGGPRSDTDDTAAEVVPDRPETEPAPDAAETTEEARDPDTGMAAADPGGADPEPAATPEPTPAPIAEASDTDLWRLPGIGAGLVWMLGQCGIRSLSDLAGADPARLSADLGLVGQLLDLRAWIALARAERSAGP